MWSIYNIAISALYKSSSGVQIQHMQTKRKPILTISKYKFNNPIHIGKWSTFLKKYGIFFLYRQSLVFFLCPSPLVLKIGFCVP